MSGKPRSLTPAEIGLPENLRFAEDPAGLAVSKAPPSDGSGPTERAIAHRALSASRVEHFSTKIEAVDFGRAMI